MVKKMKFEFHEKKSRFYDDRIDPKLLVWVWKVPEFELFQM
jgi:hypothetical protein